MRFIPNTFSQGCSPSAGSLNREPKRMQDLCLSDTLLKRLLTHGDGKEISFMKRILIFWLIALSPYHLITSVYGAFERTEGGARSSAMGSAFTALADDVNTLQFNPAGLAQLRSGEITAGYGKLYVGLKDKSDIVNNFFGAAQPIQKWNLGTIGIGYSELNLTGFYKEDTLYFSFATQFTRALAMGYSLKRFHRSAQSDIYTVRDPIFQKFGYSVSALGFDCGLLYHVGKRFSFGFAAKDLNNPNVGLAVEDRITPEYRLGASLHQKTFNYSLDLTKKSNDISYNFGTERWFLRHYALRGGLDFGSRDKRNLTLGMGYKFGIFQVDYSFVLPLSGVKETIGSHKFSLTIRFGKQPLKLEEVQKIEEQAKEGEPVSPDVRMLLEEMQSLRNQLAIATEQRNREKQELMEERMKTMNEVLGEYKKLQRLLRQKISISTTADAQAIVKPAKPALKFKMPFIKKLAPVVTTPSELPSQVSIEKVSPSTVSKQTTEWQIYIVQAGDTLQTISTKFLEKPDRWIEIYHANKGRIERGGVIKPGTVLLVPPVKKKP